MSQATIVFDLDGTLVDSAPDLLEGLNVAMAMEDLTPVTLEEIRQLVGGGVAVMLKRGLDARGCTVSDERFKELSAAFIAHYELHIADRSTLYPGVVEVLDGYRAAGRRLAVCTNKLERLARMVIENFGLTGHFDAICGGDTFVGRKPDPVHLKGTIARAGGDPAHAVLVGDSVTDFDAARNAGIPCVLMEYGYTDIPAAELGAEAVLADFADVPAAIKRLEAAAVSSTADRP